MTEIHTCKVTKRDELETVGGIIGGTNEVADRRQGGAFHLELYPSHLKLRIKILTNNTNISS